MRQARFRTLRHLQDRRTEENRAGRATTIAAHFLKYISQGRTARMRITASQKNTQQKQQTTTMKTTTIFKTMAVAALCLGTTVFASCSDDDDDNKTATLTLSKSKVEVKVGATDTLKVTKGTKPYTVKSSAEKVATVSVKSDSIFVKGVAAGSASVIVTDSAKATASLSVTVKAAK